MWEEEMKHLIFGLMLAVCMWLFAAGSVHLLVVCSRLFVVVVVCGHLLVVCVDICGGLWLLPVLVKDCRQITFATLNRFCPLSKKNPTPHVLNGQYQDG